jgi:hypothetical protein
MARRLTQKEIDRIERKIAARAATLRQSYSPEKVAEFVWNRYGYPTQVINGQVQIWSDYRHQIVATV